MKKKTNTTANTTKKYTRKEKTDRFLKGIVIETLLATVIGACMLAFFTYFYESPSEAFTAYHFAEKNSQVFLAILRCAFVLFFSAGFVAYIIWATQLIVSDIMRFERMIFSKKPVKKNIEDAVACLTAAAAASDTTAKVAEEVSQEISSESEEKAIEETDEYFPEYEFDFD